MSDDIGMMIREFGLSRVSGPLCRLVRQSIRLRAARCCAEELELGEIIENWISENTVQGRFSTTTYTQNVIRFEQVRIPLYDDKGRANDTRRWLRDLRNLLSKNPFNLTSKIYTRGLGEVWLIIGEK